MLAVSSGKKKTSAVIDTAISKTMIPEEGNNSGTNNTQSKGMVMYAKNRSSSSVSNKEDEKKKQPKQQSPSNKIPKSITTTGSTKKPKQKLRKPRIKKEPMNVPLLLNENENVTVLCEIVGGYNIACLEKNEAKQHDIYPYCIVQHAADNNNNSTIVHRTKQSIEGGCNPIWTISTGSLFLISFTPNELAVNSTNSGKANASSTTNSKRFVTISVWCRQPPKDHLIHQLIQQQQPTTCIGQCTIDLLDIITQNKLNEERIDTKLHSMDNESIFRGNNAKQNESNGTLTVRFRLATESDKRFLSSLENSNQQPHHLEQQQSKPELSSTSSSLSLMERSSRFLQLSSNTNSTTNDASPTSPTTAASPNLLITESNETEKVGETFFNAITSAFISKVKYESTSSKKKILVKPGPDPDRRKDTLYLTKDEMYQEMIQPTKQYITVGSGTIGKVYLDILCCQNLPNVDVGEAVGNYTDCFICAVFEDAVAQTSVIDDELDPIWMPWTQRGFIFNILDPSSHLYLGAFDYDIGGPLSNAHEPIGRVDINLCHLQHNTDYTLKYNLYPSSNIADKRVAAGSITIRLRIEYNQQNIKDALIQSLNLLGCPPPMKFHVNVTKEKSLAVVRYTCYGLYGNDDDDSMEQPPPFDMSIIRSYINELFEYKASISYCIYDTICSLVFWRGQVKLFHNHHNSNSGITVPLHSFLFFIYMTILIERPYLLPSFTMIGIGWIMLANQTMRVQHPSPWYRCHPFWYYIDILLFNKRGTMTSTYNFKNVIHCNEGYNDAVLYNEAIRTRIERDEKYAEHQASLQQKINEIGNDNINSKQCTNDLPMGMSFDIFVRLTRYQGMIGRYCHKCRWFKHIITWEDNILSFRITLFFLSCGFITLLLPWKFILIWTSRLVVYGFFGPHMKIIDYILSSKYNAKNSSDNNNDVVLKKMMDKFHEESKFARIKRQEAVKLQDMKCLTFGQYITRVPLRNVCRYYDRPLPESFARLSPIAASKRMDPKKKIKIAPHCIPGQQYFGVILPHTEPEMTILQKELQELRPIQEALQRTTKHLKEHHDSVLIKRLNTQASVNDIIPDSEGMELIKYSDNENSCGTDVIDINESIDNDKAQETHLFLEPGSTLSLNLKGSSQVAILYNEDKNEGSIRRRSSTFRGGYEMFPVLRESMIGSNDDDDAIYDDRTARRRSTKVYSLRLGVAGNVTIDGSRRLAIVDCHEKQTSASKHSVSNGSSSIRPAERTYEKADPLQALAKRTVSSILCEDDEERESENVEIVLCPSTIRDESVDINADYSDEDVAAADYIDEDGDEQSVPDGRCNGADANNENDHTFDDDKLFVDSSSCVLYFQPTA